MRTAARVASTLLLAAALWLALAATLPPLGEDQRAALAGTHASADSCNGVPDRPGCWFFGR
jgi:hypothetical protein